MKLANAITISRIVLAPIAAFLIIKMMFVPAIIILVIALATDIIDGYVARKLRQAGTAGKVLDYVADKTLLFLAIGALLWIFGRASSNWIFLLMFFAKDLMNLAGIIAMRRLKSIHSRKLGKAAMVLQAITIFWLLLQLPHYEFWIYAVFVLGVIAGIDYFMAFGKNIKKSSHKNNPKKPHKK